jgi:hypothetical protein
MNGILVSGYVFDDTWAGQMRRFALHVTCLKMLDFLA